MQMIVIDIESTEVLCASFDGEVSDEEATPSIEEVNRSVDEFQFP